MAKHETIYQLKVQAKKLCEYTVDRSKWSTAKTSPGCQTHNGLFCSSGQK